MSGKKSEVFAHFLLLQKLTALSMNKNIDSGAQFEVSHPSATASDEGEGLCDLSFASHDREREKDSHSITLSSPNI